MKDISKGPEPTTLQAYRRQKTPAPRYADLPAAARDAIRERLFHDQGGLCCYCMTRLDPSSSKIEHLSPQATRHAKATPRLDVDGWNLLLACPRGAGERAADQHCDTRKGNRPLGLDPSNHVERRFRYLKDGRIEVDEPRWTADIEDVLNLNAPIPSRGRKSAIDAVLDHLRRRHPGAWTAARLQNLAASLRETRHEERFTAYCMASVYSLERLAARRP